MFKKLIKLLLKRINLKLVKLNLKKPNVHPYSKPTVLNLKCILEASGILHIGAHRGTEAAVYDWLHKKVLWIEANPIIYEDLKENINKFYNQKALCALIGNDNKENIDFFISNSDAACSSIFNFSNEVKEKKLWKNRNFNMLKKIQINMITLDKLFSNHKINPEDYSHWIMDIQGAELLALNGAKSSLNYCNSIEIEISKKKYYEGGANWEEINNFLLSNNFILSKFPEKDHTEVLFLKKNFYESIKSQKIFYEN
tara:strand:+ start:23901 stop:24665 length:765 start_codon:yes stop_codon:yes gene_type:complete